MWQLMSGCLLEMGAAKPDLDVNAKEMETIKGRRPVFLGDGPYIVFHPNFEDRLDHRSNALVTVLLERAHDGMTTCSVYILWSYLNAAFKNQESLRTHGG